MFSSKELPKVELNLENIYKKVSDYDIFCHYLGEVGIGELMRSPFPFREDKHPSFNLFQTSDGGVMYKDFAHSSGSVIKFVQFMKGCNYGEALEHINKDMKLNLFSRNTPSTGNVKIKTRTIEKTRNSTSTVLQIKTKPFEEKDLEWWIQYGITLEILNFYNVYNVHTAYKNGFIYRRPYQNSPIYAYYFPRSSHIKLYMPFEDRLNKWRNNCSNSIDIQGYDQLPEKGELCIFTKSMKDCMTLYSMGYNAVAPHSESSLVNPDFFRHIKKRFNNIIILFDNDETGIQNAKDLSSKYNLNWFITPGTKDISDYYNEKGKEKTIQLLKDNII